MPKTFRAKLFFELGVAFAIIFALGLILAYLTNDLNKLSVEVYDARSGVLSKAQALDTLTKLQSDSKQAVQYMAILDRALPKRENILNFLTDTRELCKDIDGCNGIAFEPVEESPAPGKPGKVVFKINLTGTYDELTGFFKSLEATRYFTSITDFDLSMPSPGKFRGIGTGEVYFR